MTVRRGRDWMIEHRRRMLSSTFTMISTFTVSIAPIALFALRGSPTLPRFGLTSCRRPQTVGKIEIAANWLSPSPLNPLVLFPMRIGNRLTFAVEDTVATCWSLISVEAVAGELPVLHSLEFCSSCMLHRTVVYLLWHHWSLCENTTKMQF